MSTNKVSAKTETPQPIEQTSPSARRRVRKRDADVIDQAVIVRDHLTVLLSKVKEMIRTLKSERKQQRLLKSTLNSLKQIEAAE